MQGCQGGDARQAGKQKRGDACVRGGRGRCPRSEVEKEGAQGDDESSVTAPCPFQGLLRAEMEVIGAVCPSRSAAVITRRPKYRTDFGNAFSAQSSGLNVVPLCVVKFP